MDRDRLKKIMEDVRDGLLPCEEACRIFQDLQTEDLGFAAIDHHRAVRLGFPEVIFGQGKTAQQIVGIATSLMSRQDVVLITRVDEEKAAAILKEIPELDYNSLAGTLLFTRGEMRNRGKGEILVVAAGSSDLSVAEEAKVTAVSMGNSVGTLYDVGVAGIHRLLTNNRRLRDAAVVIAVAGMEGALPSVIGGLVDRPVIAVPTSVGYGAAFGGITALLAMLNSCAPGIVVVNIDNGFGAAYAATLMNRIAE
ncbi:nickel pincer cofactor biosynthesis protein LarB [Desulfomonile tiedjei]|uniref:NCAIR mutase-like protein n=1 Tax=Desulfomonile tiedjei (strain ATCC 49306 / DSM 6799 / DCB-1) TaxID=706587 RepID=I4C6D8_DESTA|nr:nickel pincer cofactor biosynthesis protein LarB [Desulfomonile tiedjei]AFM25129.1 NCAIR mutase-like protein [Desulfomonile tiedjei DSM 6799]